jgi:hypothetical protein
MLRQRRALVVGLGVGLVLSIVACSEPPSAEDQRRFDALASQLAGRYELGFEDPVYLRVRSLSESGPAVEDLREIYKAFWLDTGGEPRNDSNYVYLNAYDKGGNWKLQLYWDPKAKRVIEARDREHY